MPEGMARRALAVLRERYALGPTLACEKLRECRGIALSAETIRALMIAAGLWIPRKVNRAAARGASLYLQ
ncbi:hypothetical protein [Paraburkholderia sp. CNPSo 3274]|uniref:hypothetical protein n=1 Tax=Paraburkholderia sp. CNPSo 3274 TaxID=2940932 RepID=UPI0035CCCC11